jgi:hypothetical protein
MVLFFTASEDYVIYMGKDKYENEDLIKYGIPEDIWFHVDDMSSAHVYLRLRKDQRLEDVTDEVIMDCAQLVKANSIEGCKKSEVTVIFTRWRNLKKTSDMEVGAIGFHDRTKVKSMKVAKDNSIVNRLNKTKEERFPNLAQLQEERAAEFRAALKEERRSQLQSEKEAKKEREKQKEMRSYSSMMRPEKMTSNDEIAGGGTKDDSAARKFEEDFF